MFVVSEAWKETWPGASVGVLAMNDLANPKGHPELERRNAALEGKLRGPSTPALTELRCVPFL